MWILPCWITVCDLEVSMSNDSDLTVGRCQVFQVLVEDNGIHSTSMTFIKIHTL